jgi:type I restriction-modification system DNA methylase subunit
VSTRKTPPGDFRKILESISHRHDTRRVFDGFTRLAACAVAVQTREAEYLEEAKRWERADLDSFAMALGALVKEMEGRPFEDVLGGYYMECALSSKGQQWHGEFHTPKPICDLMTRMTLGDVESLPDDWTITVCEPACGAGAMILSFAEACTPDVRRRLRVTAMDISRTACDMAFINTTLWGVPRASSTGTHCCSNAGPHGPTSIISARGCRSCSGATRRKRKNKDNGQSLPKWSDSRFRSSSRNWRFNRK